MVSRNGSSYLEISCWHLAYNLVKFLNQRKSQDLEKSDHKQMLSTFGLTWTTNLPPPIFLHFYYVRFFSKLVYNMLQKNMTTYGL